MALYVRPAGPKDAGVMAAILNEIISIGGTTAYRQSFDAQGIISEFISPKLGISCFVAIEDSRLLGFQALAWCDPDWPGEDPLPADWAGIATYVAPHAHKKGVGRELFVKTAMAAKESGVRFINAAIRKENTGGLAFYHRMGFADYRASADTISKRFAPL